MNDPVGVFERGPAKSEEVLRGRASLLSAFSPWITICSTCKGRGYTEPFAKEPSEWWLPPTAPTEPPRAQWCEKCRGHGFRLTQEGLALLSFLDTFRDFDWRDSPKARSEAEEGAA